MDILKKIAGKFEVEVEANLNKCGGHVADFQDEAFRIPAKAMKENCPQVAEVIPYISDMASDSSAY